MIRDREMSDHQWIMVLPVNRHLKATSGEKIAIGIVTALAALMIVVLTAHVIFPGVFPL